MYKKTSLKTMTAFRKTVEDCLNPPLEISTAWGSPRGELSGGNVRGGGTSDTVVEFMLFLTVLTIP